MTTSDGSTASYYELPEGAYELQHLISHRDMNAQIGEIFRACYRYGRASHSDQLRDAKKILFYAQAEVERLVTLRQPQTSSPMSEAPRGRGFPGELEASDQYQFVDTDLDSQVERFLQIVEVAQELKRILKP